MTSNDTEGVKGSDDNLVTYETVDDVLDAEHEDPFGTKVGNQNSNLFNDDEWVVSTKKNDSCFSDITSHYLLISQMFSYLANVLQLQASFYHYCIWLVFLYNHIWKIDNYFKELCILLKKKGLIIVRHKMDVFYAWRSWIRLIKGGFRLIFAGVFHGINFQTVVSRVVTGFLNYLVTWKCYFVPHFIKQSVIYKNIYDPEVKRMRNGSGGPLRLCLHLSIIQSYRGKILNYAKSF